jgi:imidazolonepropionase
MTLSLYINIQQLVGVHAPANALRGQQLQDLPFIENAFLQIEDDKIVAFGNMNELKEMGSFKGEVVDLKGKYILPAWCDSHTHTVFAASRENEFVMKLKGLTYAEIAAAGGGILNSANKLNETSEAVLLEKAMQRANELIALGTGALEIKSGYGLRIEGELKMLRVIQQMKTALPIPVKATFLGAHTYPLAFKENHEGYLQILINEMLPNIAKEQLADYVDVFCEQGFFSADETKRICDAAAKYGLQPKLHVNQLNSIGGIEVGIQSNAVSLDHLETLNESEIKMLGQWSGICTLLPTAAYFLRMPFQPARQLIDAGAAIALASDFNPGSSPSGNMNNVVSMSCIQMKMLPAEAINAATINGAFAMQVADQVGSIAIGKKANFIVTKPMPSLDYMPYAFGSNLIDQVFINGKKF